MTDDLGQSLAANLNDPPSQLIASTTLQKAVFVEGQVDGSPEDS